MGLYDSENAAITAGDIDDAVYWEAKYAGQMTTAALETRQPEGAIADYLKEAIPTFDACLAKYKNHADVKAWKAKAVAIQTKIDPKAAWASWGAGFSWGNTADWKAGWMDVERTRFLYKQSPKNWGQIFSSAGFALARWGEDHWNYRLKSTLPADTEYALVARAEMKRIKDEADVERKK